MLRPPCVATGATRPTRTIAPAPAAKLATTMRMVALTWGDDICGELPDRRRSVNKRLPRWQMLVCGAEESSSVTPVTTPDTPTHRLMRLQVRLTENPEFQ